MSAHPSLTAVLHQASQYNMAAEFWMSLRQIRPWYRRLRWVPFVFLSEAEAADLVRQDLDLP